MSGDARAARTVGSRSELVVLCGLQASGKTSFFTERYAATHEHVSKDRMPHNRRREARQRELVAAALEAGRCVVVDNTNPSRAEREPLIGLARSFGARVVGYRFRVRLETALARNAARTGRARVPDVGVYATAARFEAPTVDEGYDELWAVTLTDTGFEVSPHQVQPGAGPGASDGGSRGPATP